MMHQFNEFIADLDKGEGTGITMIHTYQVLDKVIPCIQAI